jgi:uncharacterized small protein (DUF1192 family)
MTYIAGIQVYVSKDLSHFVLVHEAKHPQFGYGTAFGPMERVNRERMHELGLQMVLFSIEEAPSRIKSERAEIENLSKAEQRKINQAHYLLSISLSSDKGELRISGLKFEKGRHVDIQKPVKISMPTDRQAFFEGLVAASEYLKMATEKTGQN